MLESKTQHRSRGDSRAAGSAVVRKGKEQKRKVHTLIDKVYSRKNLELAWEKVRSKRGSGGVDGVTIDKFAEKSDWYLDRLHQKLKTDTYKPKPVEQVLIPKEGGQRRLGIPTIMDRVCQQALVNRMEPIFESKFLDCNFGYRKGKSPHDAMKKIWKELNQGCLWVVDADLQSYFDTIDQEKLIDLIAEEISDGRVLRLTRMMLQAGLMKGKSWEPTLTGVPQGGVVSPLWSNIFLHPFDEAMTGAGYQLTRWADDFVVLCRTKSEAEAALSLARRFLQEGLGVQLHPEKTRIVHVRQGFEFLGYKIAQGKGHRLPRWKRQCRGNALNLYAVPRDKSVKRFKDQVRRLTRRKAPVTLEELIRGLNPVIRGWGNYYRKANVRTLFNRLDRWIERRLYSFLAKRWRNAMWRRYPTKRLIQEYGLVRLFHLTPSFYPVLLPEKDS